MDDNEELSTNTLTCTDIWCVKTRWARIRHRKVIFRFQSRQAWAFWATIPPFTAPLNGKWGSTPPLVHPPAAGLKGQEMPLIYWPNWADFMFFDWFPDSLRLRYPQVRSPLGEEHASWTYKLMHFISNVLYLISTHCYNLDYVNMSIYIYMSIRMICRMNPSDQDMGLELLTFRTLVRGSRNSSTRMSWEGWWKLTCYFFLGCWITVMATVCIGIFRKLVVLWVATIWELDPVPSWGSKVCFFWGGR